MISCILENGRKTSFRHVGVDAIAVQDHKILLVKRAAHIFQGGLYSLPGGFLDRDERTEDAVKREVMEETGYETTVATLFRINDNPERKNEERQNVDFVYLVSLGEQKNTPDAEVQDVHWFSFDKLPDPSNVAFDHLDTIELYRRYLRNSFTLPYIG